jgi:hypothetical protein
VDLGKVERMAADNPSGFPILDGPTPRPALPSYHLEPDEQRRMAHLANHLAKREAEMPLRRRIKSWQKSHSLGRLDH